MELDDVLAIDHTHQLDLIFDPPPSISPIGYLLHECFYGHQPVFLQVFGQINRGEVALADLLRGLEEFVEILPLDASE